MNAVETKKASLGPKKVDSADKANADKAMDVKATEVKATEVKATEVKKSEAVERLELMINGSNSKLAKDIKSTFSSSLDEHQRINNLKFAEILGAIDGINNRLSNLEKMNSTVSTDKSSDKSNIESKLDDFKKSFEFDMNWIKLTLELLNKNDVIGVTPVVKGEVKTKAKQSKSASVEVSTEDSSTAVSESVTTVIKTANTYFKHYIKDKKFVEKLFADEYNEFVSSSFCTHIKLLPLAKEFGALPIDEKISEFLAHSQKNEATNSKLITLLNKNAALKEMVSQDFEKWKNDCKLNGNKHFLDEV